MSAELTATVVWLVIWFFAVFLVPATAVWAGGLIGLLVGDEEGAVVGAFIGWVLGIVGLVFSVIQVVLHILEAIRLVV